MGPKTKLGCNVISTRNAKVPQKNVILTSWKICYRKKSTYNVILM